ncbi:heavy-metal-associated domain-containing protein [Corynebacterium lowii]|uniref:Zinc/cadmium/mercury/lead-transporting ATPase n=1 Tax=Corynebacterium lowii TaxID=1544413 RepID=A0A0Q1AIB5_9CORY|nr:cation transporter [Corynebacterium lowii]KQB86383.1 zinc/cadmium/mercury/lead-transporting ATPase [Corynebacterium lowii]MDP9850868.1 copper chaperone CopZ [Corynebacterium lowii]
MRTYTITGMSCAHCENAVREELSKIPGLTIKEISATTGTLVVESEQPLDDATVLAAVAEAGYEASRDTSV